MISKNASIFKEVQDRYNIVDVAESLGIRFHSLRTLNNAPQKTRNFCCFFIAYSAFPNLKTYGKISQNLKGKKALKNFFEGCNLAPQNPYHTLLMDFEVRFIIIYKF